MTIHSSRASLRNRGCPLVSDAAVRMARELGPGHTIVTILCDYGNRYQSKLFNPAFLKEKGLPVPDWIGQTPQFDIPFEQAD